MKTGPIFFLQHFKNKIILNFVKSVATKKDMTNFFSLLSFVAIYGSGMGKNQDPGSGINIPDPQHCWKVCRPGVAYSHHFDKEKDPDRGKKSGTDPPCLPVLRVLMATGVVLFQGPSQTSPNCPKGTVLTGLESLDGNRGSVVPEPFPDLPKLSKRHSTYQS